MAEVKENQVDDEKSALGGLGEGDYKSWRVHLLRFSTGTAEAFRERLRSVELPGGGKIEGLIVEAFGNFAIFVCVCVC